MRIVAVVLAALAFVPAAGAKDGVRATLTRPLPILAVHGQHIVVAFTLRDRAGRPVDARHVFVKLTCPQKTDFSIAFASSSHPDGRYRVVAIVPPGGLGAVAIGLHGRSDVYFPITNNPLRSRF